MNLRRLRKGEWITAISGLVLLVSLFLPWWDPADSPPISGWSALSVLDVVLALLAVAALATLLTNALAPSTAPGVASQALLTPFALVMSVICLFKLDEFNGDGTTVALLAAIGVLVGALVGMRDERLSRPGELTDQTGVPVEQAIEIEKLPAPPPA